ncbi:winged helix-turn-helix transcriptional regulator [Fictibacillus sp. 5RED26]|uniref:ArsR/SmtB family transcription factor n=1 Tax=Fictibacillus sp. 5RED26 TaxID=2745876 RepID=UPI0018CEADEC|nr:ArsR family transcriptional regulator [Fictibacillus sp. 5RED26]MBH0155318.1 winged helix-turn-helix transcriptional regulator [Fictibacillus sp. 5RED26]
MKNIHSPHSQETVNLSIESSPIWELALGIAGYTYAKLRHTFEQDEQWTNRKSLMTVSLENNLDKIEQTNLWYGMIMLQNKVSASSIGEFSVKVSELPSTVFYETLLPYKNRSYESHRTETAKCYEQPDAFYQYASLFKGHDYLEGYVRTLGSISRDELHSLLTDTLSEWYNWLSQNTDWEKWMQALSFEKKQHGLLDNQKPLEEIERVTRGAKYVPEPSVWNIKLIPHVSYRPWILEQKTTDTKLIFYPLTDEALLEPGSPPNELVRGHKALGDELRLKVLYQLMRGPLSLQELTIQFNVSKTTLHHQLSLLKAAKFVKVEKGIYSANTHQIHSFSNQLQHYLGEKTNEE